MKYPTRHKLRTGAVYSPLPVIGIWTIPVLFGLLFAVFATHLRASEREVRVHDEKSHFISLGRNILHTLAGDDLSAFFGFTPSIEIVHSHAPNAFAMAPGTLLLSTGLCQHFASESEYAFVIAHEIAHLILHTESDHSMHSSAKELEADAFAIKLLNQGGFNPQAGILLLRRLHDAVPDNETLELRVATMEAHSIPIEHGPRYS